MQSTQSDNSTNSDRESKQSPKSRMNVILNTRFSATHQWSRCPYPEVAYLKMEHRHEFHVQMKFKVRHDDRDIEFIRMKEIVNRFIVNNWEAKFLGNMSCEMIAKRLMKEFDACYVRVMEDGENGAEVFSE